MTLFQCAFCGGYHTAAGGACPKSVPDLPADFNLRPFPSDILGICPSCHIKDINIMVLLSALKPFSDAFDETDDKVQDNREIWERPEAMNITIGDLRNARKTLLTLLP